MWERELLLTTFLSWKKYTSKEWQRIEIKANELGDIVVERYCFQRWRINLKIEAELAARQFEIIHLRRNDYILESHFSKWVTFSRSRGKRMRKTRILWKQWQSFVRQQKSDLRGLALTMKTIQLSRKAHILNLWREAKISATERHVHDDAKMKAIRPDLLYLLSLWIGHSPLLTIKCYFYSVSQSLSCTKIIRILS